MLDLLIGVGITALMLVVFGSIGKLRERRHFTQIANREKELEYLLVMNTRNSDPGFTPTQATLVTGEVVVGSDYLKTFLTSIRNLFGGEMKSFAMVMERTRREALIRMLDEAQQLRARAVVNVRFETSEVGGPRLPAAEILCYGTAIS
jgi:uncharacterized protein YbjQ (UPF0145 family)